MKARTQAKLINRLRYTMKCSDIKLVFGLLSLILIISAIEIEL